MRFICCRLRVCRDDERRGAVAWQVGRGPTLFDKEKRRWATIYYHSLVETNCFTTDTPDLLSKHSILVFAGDLLPRHMQIFKKNDFFVGVSLPEPEVMDPLEEKLAKSVTPEGLDFALVINARAGGSGRIY